MGMLDSSIAALKGVFSDLFPEEAPATPQFPTVENTQEPVITVHKSSKAPVQPIGKITSYNYKGDKYSDSKSRKGKGAWENKLTQEGIAVSPDIEEMMVKAGIKPLDRIQFDLDTGDAIRGMWQDRTMQDKQAIKEYGQPLRGRIDLNVPHLSHPHPLDGAKVIGFHKIVAE